MTTRKRSRQTYYVELLMWVEADSEEAAQNIAKHVANVADSAVMPFDDPSWGGRVTSCTVNCVEEQERIL